MKHQAVRTRSELVKEFDESPDDTLFDTTTIAAVESCSKSKLERDRWAGNGIPFLKLGRHVRYRKSTVLTHINQKGEFKSTTQFEQHHGGEGLR